MYEKEPALISHYATMIYDVAKLMNVLESAFCDSFLNTTRFRVVFISRFNITRFRESLKLFLFLFS